MATRIWTGTTGSWTNPALWLPSGGGIPQTGDTSLITTGDVTLAGLSLSNQSIVMSGSSFPVLELQGTTLDTLSSLAVLAAFAGVDASGRSEIDGTLEFGNSGILSLAASSSLVLGGTLKVDVTPGSTAGGRAEFDLASGATLDIENTASITRPLYIVSTGTSGQPNGTVINNGVITVIGTGLTFYNNGSGASADLTGTGLVTLKSASATFNATSAGQTIAIDPSGYSSIGLSPSDLTSGAFKATITGFYALDSIALGTSLVDAVSYNSTTHVLTTSYSGIQTGTLTILGNYLTSNFFLTSTGTGVTLTTNVVCFASGTRIRTTRGAVAVEELRIGDIAITLTGRRPIVWLGRRDVDCTAQAYPLSVWPVRVLAGAFGADLPCRDLYLSPEHAVFAQGVLIPVSELVNGASIFSVARERVTYWHVELDAHDVIFAEGLPVESYMENGNRQDFDGQGAPGEGDCFTPPCAPIVRQGLVFEAVCRALERALVQLEVLGVAL